MSENKPLTGYPSIDKPWLKYYPNEVLNASLPAMTLYQYAWESNKVHLTEVAFQYYGTKITYEKLFHNIKAAASSFQSFGVRSGDVVTIMSMHTPETIYCIYALNYIGAVANMVYMTLAEREIVETLQNTKSKMFIALDATIDRVLTIKDKLNIPVLILT